MAVLQPLSKPFARRFASALVLVFLAQILLPQAQAATYYWDSNNSTAGFGTAQGTWAAPTTNDATQGWSTSSTGVNAMSGNTTTNTADTLWFGTDSNQLGTGTVTVSGNVSANYINFRSSSSNISLSGGNITVQGYISARNSGNTTAITDTISSNITLNATQNWEVINGGSVGTANLNVSGNVRGGSYNLSKAGNGTLTLSGAANSWNGTTTVSTGTLTLSGSLTTTGEIRVNGSSSANPILNITGNLTQTRSANVRNFVIAGTVNNVGTVNVSGSANVTLTGMYISEDGGGNGVFNQTGGTVNSSGGVNMAGQTSALNVSGGTFNMGSTTLTMGAGATYGSNSTLTVNGTGSIIMGTLTMGLASRNATAMTVNLGDGATGGNLTINSMSYGAGAGSGPTTINFNGGTLTANNTFSMISQASTVVKSGGAIINVVPSRTFTIGTALTDGGGGGGLTKNGTGTLTLSGNNTYTGTTTINAGQLNINSATAIGTGTLTINGGTIDNTSAAAITLSNNNAQNWNSDFTFTGTKDLNLGTGAVAMNASRTVTVSGGNLTVGGAISGAGFGLTKNGSGNLTLSGANSYTGTTTINAGSLRLGANQNLGAIAGAGALDLSSYTLTTNASSDSTFSGVISGTGALTKNGTGTLTLSNASTYNGSTTVNAGTLSVTGNISSSALTINSGGNLTGTGTVGAVTLNSGGMIGAGTGTSTVGKLSGTSLTIDAGTGYAFTIGSVSTSVAGTDYDQIALSGGLTLSNTAASPFTVYLYGTPTGWSNTGDYHWNIISAASLSGFSAGNFTTDFTNFGIASGDRTGTWSFSNPSTGIIQLSYTAASGNSTWNSTTGNWDNAAKWVENAIPVNANNLTFNGTGGGTSTNNISNATLTTVKNITFASGAGAYTLAASAGSAGASGGTALGVTGNIVNNSTNLQTLNLALGFGTTRTVDTASGNITISGVISGAGGLIKEGSSTLTLSAANSYTGNTTINNGTLAIGGSNVLTGNVTINSGATLNGGNNHGPVTSSTNLIINGGTVIGGYTQQLASVTMTNGTLQGHSLFNGGIDNYYVTGGWTLAGNNTITGGIDMRSVQANSGTFNTTSGTTTISGTIGNTQGAQILGLTKNGSGTLTLTGNNTYTGTTTINAGTISVGHANALGSGGNITFSGGGVQYGSSTPDISSRIKNSGSAILVDTNSNNVTFSSVVGTTNTGGLTKNGSGTLTLTAANTYTGGTTVNAGTLQIGNRTNTTAAVTGTITLSGGNLTYDFNNSNFVVNGAITLTNEATITKLNAAYQYNFNSGTLNGGGQTLNIYSDTTGGTKGGIYFNQTAGTSLGQVNILNGYVGQSGSGGRPLQNAAINVSSGAQFQTYSTVSINNNITLNGGAGPDNNGALYNSGAGAATFSGTITLTSSTDSSIGTAGGNITISGQVTGSGSLTKIGANTLTLSNSTTNYTGTTTVSAGTLAIGNNMTIGAITGSGNLSLGSGYTLTTNASSDTTYSGVISGSGSLAKSGAGTLTLTNSNNYSGGTTLNTGTLVIAHVNGAGNGTITQTDGTSLLKLDTTGTIANAMSIYNVSANKTVTLSGGITVNNAVVDVASGETLTISNTINGTGGVTKNGTGTLVLSGNNSYTAPTIINSGILEAANAAALGSNNTVEVNGGTLLVSTDGAINGKEITLNGTSTTVATLSFNNNYNGTIQKLTLSADSIIDLGPANTVALAFADLAMGLYNLSIYNWSGTTKWGTTYGNGTDTIFFGNQNTPDYTLANVKFYSGAVGSDSFVGSGFEVMPATTWEGGFTGHYIIPVPEPETYATGLLLLLGGAWWMWRKRKAEA